MEILRIYGGGLEFAPRGWMECVSHYSDRLDYLSEPHVTPTYEEAVSYPILKHLPLASTWLSELRQVRQDWWDPCRVW